MNSKDPLTKERLCRWNTLLSGSKKECVDYRKGPVGVYNGSIIGKEQLIYETPDRENLPSMMDDFIKRIDKSSYEPIIKSAIASFYFVTIHPFNDGNGRISRAVADYVLSREMNGSISHFCSMSIAIEREKMLYFGLLQKLQCQCASLDLREWLRWYISLATKALEDVRDEFRNIIILTQAMASPHLDGLN